MKVYKKMSDDIFDPFTEVASEASCETPCVVPIQDTVPSENTPRKKRYIYNKTGQLSRFRSCAIKPSFLC